jgi:hypothetical protein
MFTFPKLSKGGYDRWATRLGRLEHRMSHALGFPPLALEDVPGRADVAEREGVRWLEVDFAWLYHRARAHGPTPQAQRSVAAYAIGVLYARAHGNSIGDPLVGRALRTLKLPLEPAQAFAATLTPIDPLRLTTDPRARVFGLGLGYSA